MLRSKGVNEHLRIKGLMNNKSTRSLKTCTCTCTSPTNILEGNQRVNKSHLDGSPYANLMGWFAWSNSLALAWTLTSNNKPHACG